MLDQEKMDECILIGYIDPVEGMEALKETSLLCMYMYSCGGVHFTIDQQLRLWLAEDSLPFFAITHEPIREL